MMYSVKIAPGADKVLAKWKKSNPQLISVPLKWDELNN